jgi:hypothetical protein
MNEQTMTTKEIAELCNIDETTVKRCIKRFDEIIQLIKADGNEILVNLLLDIFRKYENF